MPAGAAPPKVRRCFVPPLPRTASPRSAFISLLGLAAVTAIFAGPALGQPTSRAAAIRSRFEDPRGGVLVVAHRGCHNPSPRHGQAAAPENSLAALENCVRLGADMMETDIRRAKDGTLVVIHDATVDRTTNGHGRVADLTLAELKDLRLRQNFGAAMSPELTDQRVLTLDEILAAARGRIMLNLDIKEPIYPEVVAAAVRAGVADQVLVKIAVDRVEPPLADQPPYRDTLFMPMVEQHRDQPKLDAGAIAAAQAGGTHRIAAVESVFLDQAQLRDVRAAAGRAGFRLWANTLTSVGVVSVLGLGGDLDALRDHGRTWGRLIDAGVSVFQTDEPAELIDYLKRGDPKHDDGAR